ncbi:methyltransferase [Echinicola strongylocentroti]|uniref:tRNA1(Val) (adenine(37)-N6)-methyltransferase n=1 Tax=Echinicola strongylocentroti TaxID=1795355 RepID=A0A2Z4IK33_9BACT|nr:methyltransferase [Echinicola strongylocentroti]AWW31324.1 methyltransferase [Echinicola strongylocentroti]
MPNTYFRFKQFTVHQENCAMKVSTDAVLLGALTDQAQPTNILDIGAGTGVISLMLAQRYEKAMIQGIEVDPPAAQQAQDNVLKSPWCDRIAISQMRFQDFVKDTSEKFSLIVSNPPYFPKHNKSHNAQRNLALHNDELPFGDLIKGVVKLLDTESGSFWVILPPQQMKELDKIARFFGLHCHAWHELRDRPSTKVLRHLCAYSFTTTDQPISKTICIKNEDFTYSEQYQYLLKDFLLIF